MKINKIAMTFILGIILILFSITPIHGDSFNPTAMLTSPLSPFNPVSPLGYLAPVNIYRMNANKNNIKTEEIQQETKKERMTEEEKTKAFIYLVICPLLVFILIFILLFC